MDKYSNWLLNQKNHNWKVIDIHFPLKKYLANQRLKNKAFFLAADGVHLNEQGHQIISNEILNYLGEKPVDSFDPTKLNYYPLITERQVIMKNAWLTSIGHKRPQMEKGISMETALKMYNDIEIQILKLSK